MNTIGQLIGRRELDGYISFVYKGSGQASEEQVNEMQYQTFKVRTRTREELQEVLKRGEFSVIWPRVEELLNEGSTRLVFSYDRGPRGKKPKKGGYIDVQIGEEYSLGLFAACIALCPHKYGMFMVEVVDGEIEEEDVPDIKQPMPRKKSKK